MLSYVIAAFLLGIGVGYLLVDFRYALLRKETEEFLKVAFEITEKWERDDQAKAKASEAQEGE